MPPAIYRDKRPLDGEAADMRSAGTVLFCMITGNRSCACPHKSDDLFLKMTTEHEELLKVMGVIL